MKIGIDKIEPMFYNRFVDPINQSCFGGSTMSYNCEILEKPAQPSLAIRTRTAVADLPQLMGKSYQAIAQLLGELGEQPAGPPYAAYFNMEMQNLDVEVGFPVHHVLSGKGQIVAGEIPGGKLASCQFTGPYSDMVPAYEALQQWVSEEGYEATGVSYEVYLNDPAQTPPQELMTQIIFPLKSGG
jgi:effector-binding domain-containing protein